MKKSIQKGFTLIELMIVVAIIGILAAFAIPAYNDYITRTQVSEGVELLAGLKTPLSQYGGENSEWPTLVPAGAADVTAKQIAATLTGKYAKIGDGASVTATGTYPKGLWTATMEDGSRASGKDIFLYTTDGGGVWSCATSSEEAKKIPLKWLPTACKTAVAPAEAIK